MQNSWQSSARRNFIFTHLRHIQTSNISPRLTVDAPPLSVSTTPIFGKCTPFLRLHQNPNRIFIFPMRSSENIKHSPITTAFIHLFHLVKMPLQAPAEADYATLKALMKAMQNHAFTKGYAIVKARFKSNKLENVIKIVFSCNRDESSRRKSKTQAKRRIGSIKCDCLFKINAVYKKTLNAWTMNV